MMNTSNISDLDLTAMLPHRKPMLMISEVLSYHDEQLIASSLVDVSNPLLQAGKFPGYGCLELLAQASGLFLGLRSDGKASAAPGAIVSVRDMEVMRSWLLIDTPMHIETNFLGGSDRAAMFQGKVYQADKVVMQATLTVSSFPEGETT